MDLFTTMVYRIRTITLRWISIFIGYNCVCADVIDYGIKFGTRNDQLFVCTNIPESFTSCIRIIYRVGLALVGYIPDVAQTPTAIMGIRINV